MSERVRTCPHALDGAIYQACPLVVHGPEGAIRCKGCPAVRPSWHDSAEYRRGYAAAIAHVRAFIGEYPDSGDERIACHLIEVREAIRGLLG